MHRVQKGIFQSQAEEITPDNSLPHRSLSLVWNLERTKNNLIPEPIMISTSAYLTVESTRYNTSFENLLTSPIPHVKSLNITSRDSESKTIDI